jgi:hypothetical protein
MSKRQAIGVTVGLYLGLASFALAQYDGSAPLLCTPITILECQATGECQKGTVESVNVPQFIEVDVAKKRLSDAEDGDTTTAIKHVMHPSGRLILHGDESGRGWSLVISKETGKMSLTVAEDQTDFVIFGACTRR